MRFSVLASGSSGNAIFVESEKTRLLVDAGLSGKELTRRLASIGVNPAHLDGILVTHEHIDHVSGVGIMARRYGLPVYVTPDTLAASRERMGWLPSVVSFESARRFRIGNIRVNPFAIPHDAVDPLGFTFCANGKKLGLATDMGCVSFSVREQLRGTNALILESNHDLQMLREGPYAWPLKQRVMGTHGHLSNADAGDLLRELIHENLETVVLAHISKINNRLGVAFGSAETVVQASEHDVRLFAARQGEVGSLIEVQHGSAVSPLNRPAILP